jgi:hypothetical protein
METMLRYAVTLYLAGSLFLVIGYSLAGTPTSTILFWHLMTTVAAIGARHPAQKVRLDG